MEIKGPVIRKTVSKSSKSEHDAVCIKIEDDTYMLRQRGKNAFNNPELEELVGKLIKASGEIVGKVFFVRNYTIIDHG
jgi:hypothetical protein